MAFTAKILSWGFRHLNIVGCLLKRKSTKGGGGGHGHPRSPFSYAPVLRTGVSLKLKIKHNWKATTQWTKHKSSIYTIYIHGVHQVT